MMWYGDEQAYFDVVIHGHPFSVDGHWAAITTRNTREDAANDDEYNPKEYA